MQDSSTSGAPTAQGGSSMVVSAQKDLAPPSLDGKDAYEKFELSLPFCRTPIKQFEANVAKAEEACGKEGFVTIDALNKVFTSSAWA